MTQAGREKFRHESQELDKKEGDLAVLASLRAMRSLPSSCEDLRSSIKYQFRGMQICKTAFLFSNAVGAPRLKNLINHYDTEGLSVRVHKNSRKRPHNKTENEEVEKIKKFIEKFTVYMHSPWLVDYQHTRIIELCFYLPTCLRVMSMGSMRKHVSDQLNCISFRTFVNIWNKLCPYIATVKPATDLCRTCQQNSNLLMKSANMAESVKSQRIKDALAHLDLARIQRKH